MAKRYIYLFTIHMHGNFSRWGWGGIRKKLQYLTLLVDNSSSISLSAHVFINISFDISYMCILSSRFTSLSHDYITYFVHRLDISLVSLIRILCDEHFPQTFMSFQSQNPYLSHRHVYKSATGDLKKNCFFWTLIDFDLCFYSHHQISCLNSDTYYDKLCTLLQFCSK